MTFSQVDFREITTRYYDPLVIELKIAMALIRRILIDIGSSVDIIALECLKQLKYPGRDLTPPSSYLGFKRRIINSNGLNRLPMRLGDKERMKPIGGLPTGRHAMAYNVMIREAL